MTRLVQRALALLVLVTPLVVVGCGGSTVANKDATPVGQVDGPAVAIDVPVSPGLDVASPDTTPVLPVDAPLLAPDSGPVVGPEAGVADALVVPDSSAVTPDAGQDVTIITTDGPLAAPDATKPDAATPDAATPDASIPDTAAPAADACAPVCTGKHCGDSDGCGGTCSGTCLNGLSCCNNACVALGSDLNNCGTCGTSCGTSGTCVAGTCGSCTPNCTGKNCGSDGCGGLCGLACTSSNPFCIQGGCHTCTPSCAGAACGASDGCGGRCQGGTCASGTCSTAGYCSTCVPSCTGKSCGDPDGCGGKCTTGSCKGGGSCGSDGTCGVGCVPNCAGKLCGSNGCGGSCGICVWPEICGDSSVLTTNSSLGTPTWTCIDQSLGCANGAREGYLDTGKYPTIAGCAMSASTATNSGDLRKTRTGKWCGYTDSGNDFGNCDAAEDACSPGWHICGRNGAPKDLTDRIVLDDCISSNEANSQGFVAALSPIDITSATCCPATNPATFACPNDTSFSGSTCDTASLVTTASPVACGVNAVQTASCSDFSGWSDAVPVFGDESCGNFSGISYYGGILCCQDPAHTGN